jgi:hypothetical protein
VPVAREVRSTVRVYFHLKGTQEQILDHEGVKVSDRNQAHVQALRAMEELRNEVPSVSQDWSGWILTIADRRGAVLLSIDLGAHTP